jgi:hypothetical protein
MCQAIPDISEEHSSIIKSLPESAWFADGSRPERARLSRDIETSGSPGPLVLLSGVLPIRQLLLQL